MDAPQYYAYGADIPRALDAVASVRRSGQALDQELDAQLVGLARLVTAPAGRTPVEGRPRVTIASDLHNNVITLPILERAAGDGPVFFPGDLSDRGSPLETALVARVAEHRPAVRVRHRQPRLRPLGPGAGRRRRGRAHPVRPAQARRRLRRRDQRDRRDAGRRLRRPVRAQGGPELPRPLHRHGHARAAGGLRRVDAAADREGRRRARPRARADRADARGAAHDPAEPAAGLPRRPHAQAVARRASRTST